MADTTEPTGTTGTTPTQQAGTRQPAPVPELERFEPWVGRWSTEEIYEASPYAPDGGTGHGTLTDRLGPAGLLIEEHHSEGGPLGAFDGLGVFTWDTKEKIYLCHWFDSYLPGGMTAKGRWEGDRLVFEGDGGTMDGKRSVFRMTYSNVTPTSRTLTSEMGLEGGPMKKNFTIHFRKDSPSAETHRQRRDVPSPGGVTSRRRRRSRRAARARRRRCRASRGTCPRRSSAPRPCRA